MSRLTDAQRIRIWPGGMHSPMDETVEKVSTAIATHLWRGDWPPTELEYREMEWDLQADADGVLLAALDVIDMTWARAMTTHRCILCGGSDFSVRCPANESGLHHIDETHEWLREGDS